MTSGGDLPLGLFLDQATRAVLACQSRLDRAVNPRSSRSPRPGQRLFYALPRATFEIESAMVLDHRRVRFTRRGRRETLEHRLGFQLISVPESPPGLATATPRIELREPAFLATTAQEKTLFAALQSGLATAGGWHLVDAETTRRALTADPRLRRRIRRLAEGLRPERLVFFPLPGSGYLAAGVEGLDLESDERRTDSLFLLQPDATPRVRVFNFPGSPLGDRIPYDPLHRLALAIRHWQEGSSEDHLSPWDDSRRPGFEGLDAFVHNLERAYGRNLERLAEQSDPATLPSFYDLAEVEAHLRFSIETTRGRVSFDELLETDDPEPDTSATSSVALRAERRGGRPVITVSLEEIEFLPQAEKREALLDWILENHSTIARRLAPRDAARYRELLTDPELRRAAVVFRTYRVRRAEEALVVIWPGEPGSGDPSLAFAVEKRGEKVGDVEAVLGAGDAVSRVTLTREHFAVLHRFFVALRLWRNRGAE